MGRATAHPESALQSRMPKQKLPKQSQPRLRAIASVGRRIEDSWAQKRAKRIAHDYNVKTLCAKALDRFTPNSGAESHPRMLAIASPM